MIFNAVFPLLRLNIAACLSGDVLSVRLWQLPGRRRRVTPQWSPRAICCGSGIGIQLSIQNYSNNVLKSIYTLYYIYIYIFFLYVHFSRAL